MVANINCLKHCLEFLYNRSFIVTVNINTTRKARSLYGTTIPANRTHLRSKLLNMNKKMFLKTFYFSYTILDKRTGLNEVLHSDHRKLSELGGFDC